MEAGRLWGAGPGALWWLLVLQVVGRLGPELQRRRVHLDDSEVALGALKLGVV